MNRELCSSVHEAEYAREELRAEMASAFLQMELGFPLAEEGMKTHVEQHAAYVQSWLQHFKKDYKEFYRAIQDATKIAEYVLAYDGERVKADKTAAISEENEEPEAVMLACGVFKEKSFRGKTPFERKTSFPLRSQRKSVCLSFQEQTKQR
jgi:hypothetical protein